MCNKKYGIIYFLLNSITKEIFFIGCSKNETLNIIFFDILFNSFYINSKGFNSRLCNYIRLLNLNDRHGYINIEIYELEYFERIDDDTEFLFKKRYWIELFKPICNKTIPIRSGEEEKKS